MAIDESRLPLVLSSSVPRVQGDGRPTRQLLDNEFLTRAWYLQNAVDLDQKITTVESRTDENEASIIEERNARTSADEAEANLRLELKASTESGFADVTTEIEALQTADTSIAARQDTFDTRLETNEADLTVLQGSYDGIAVLYSVTGTIDGTTGGFTFGGIKRNDGTVVYDLTIDANVTINGDVVVNGTLSGQKIGANNLFVPIYNVVQSDILFASGAGTITEATIAGFSSTFMTEGQDCVLDINADAQFIGKGVFGNPTTVILYIAVNGTIVGEVGRIAGSVGANVQHPVYSKKVAFLQGAPLGRLAAGTHTVTFKYTYISSDPSGYGLLKTATEWAYVALKQTGV